MATGSGPHAGASGGQLVHRFTFEGRGTLEWVVQRHAAIAAVFGLAAIGVFLLLRRKGGDRRALRPLTALICLLGIQGIVGGVQWELKLPTEIVWVHVALATSHLAGDALDGCRRRPARATPGNRSLGGRCRPA